jgi:hypothetical protein
MFRSQRGRSAVRRAIASPLTNTVYALVVACCLSGACGSTTKANDNGDDAGGGAGGGPDAGGGGTSGDDGSSGGFTAGDAQNSPQGDGCASADAKPVRIPVSVWLVIDISQVEANGFSVGTNPPPAAQTVLYMLRSALLDAGGLVPSLQSVEAFGFVGVDSGYCSSGVVLDAGYLTPYDGGSDLGCPDLRVVPPALMNESAIADAFPTNIVGGTSPSTVYGVQYVLSQMPSAAQVATHPQAVILAFRGSSETLSANVPGFPYEPANVTPLTPPPQFVWDPSPALESMEYFEQQMVARGAKVFTINMGDTAAVAVQAQQQIAEIGNTGSGPFTPQNATDLNTAVQKILTASVSCDVALTGTVVAGQECKGVVTVSGAAVACNDPNGWTLKDPGTIELVGTACANLQSHPDAEVQATFPCAAFLPPK